MLLRTIWIANRRKRDLQRRKVCIARENTCKKGQINKRRKGGIDGDDETTESETRAFSSAFTHSEPLASFRPIHRILLQIEQKGESVRARIGQREKASEGRERVERRGKDGKLTGSPSSKRRSMILVFFPFCMISLVDCIEKEAIPGASQLRKARISLSLDRERERAANSRQREKQTWSEVV